jgi:hypothetical protein
MIKDMLHCEIKIITLICASVVLFSCKKEFTKEEIKQIDITRMNEAAKKRSIYMSFAKKIMGEKEYYAIYNNAKDTISNWIKNDLKYTTVYKAGFTLDSLLCFNDLKNKCVMAFSYNNLITDTYEGMDYFYGVNIKNRWYFFMGSHIMLPRDYYQDDIHKLLSKELLKQIPIEEIYNGYLIAIPSATNSNKVQYKINNSAFINMENRDSDGRFDGCYDCKTFDESVIYRVNKNWKYKMNSSDDVPSPPPFRVVE